MTSYDVIEVGAGWTGSLGDSEWAAETTGSAEFNSYLPCAHWDRMPDQVLYNPTYSSWTGGDFSSAGAPALHSELFKVGVIAYHRSHVESVTYSLDAGEPIRIDAMKANDDTNHYSYAVAISHTGNPGQVYELRARVTPSGDGTDRLLSWKFINGIDYAPPQEVWVDPTREAGIGESGFTRGDAVDTLGAAFNNLGQGSGASAGIGGSVIYIKNGGNQPVSWGEDVIGINNEDIPIYVRPDAGEQSCLIKMEPKGQFGNNPRIVDVNKLTFYDCELDASWEHAIEPSLGTTGASGDIDGAEGYSLFFDECTMVGRSIPLNRTHQLETVDSIVDIDSYNNGRNLYFNNGNVDNIDGNPIAYFGWVAHSNLTKIKGLGFAGGCFINSRIRQLFKRFKESPTPHVNPSVFLEAGGFTKYNWYERYIDNVLIDAIQFDHRPKDKSKEEHMYIGRQNIKNSAIVNCLFEGTKIHWGVGYPNQWFNSSIRNCNNVVFAQNTAAVKGNFFPGADMVVDFSFPGAYAEPTGNEWHGSVFHSNYVSDFLTYNSVGNPVVWPSGDWGDLTIDQTYNAYTSGNYVVGRAAWSTLQHERPEDTFVDYNSWTSDKIILSGASGDMFVPPGVRYVDFDGKANDRGVGNDVQDRSSLGWRISEREE